MLVPLATLWSPAFTWHIVQDYSKKWGDFIERVGDVMVATHEVLLATPLSIPHCTLPQAYNKDFRVKTFIHGDPWFNNMFFKYSADGSVEDLLMFDLQVSCDLFLFTVPLR